MRVLLTGAAGFVGTAISRELRARGHDVAGIDAYIPQAHGTTAAVSPPGVRVGDIRIADDVRTALAAADVVCHQAAMVGAGVTAVDMPLYASHNDLGTAVLLAEMAARRVDRLVLASSMVVYGDGRYVCPVHDDQQAPPRTRAELSAGRFETRCPRCGVEMGWGLVDEDCPLRPRSTYAASKVAQEHYASSWARQLPGATIALRYHNVYGPGMPQDTPYSGVAAMFRSAVERGEAPRVFEDGGQMRDFVHVDDVAVANAQAVEQVTQLPDDTFAAYNVCSGVPVSIADVAGFVARGSAAASALDPVTTGEYRLGDVRHVVASPARATERLGFTARVGPAVGLAEFASAPLRRR
jgi:dTDP-L-rhamnose 4-epimerase